MSAFGKNLYNKILKSLHNNNMADCQKFNNGNYLPEICN